MRTIRKELKQCFSCMEEHEIEIVEVEETDTFKGESVTFNAIYEYCVNADEYSETEELMRSNSLAQKDAYRNKVGLLTSNEIKRIREKYMISQKEFSEVLGWSPATIIRYENHQVQDRAHDDILRKIDSDPQWFIELLERAKKNIAKYSMYRQNAGKLLKLNMKMSPYTSVIGNTNYSHSRADFSPYKTASVSQCYNLSAGHEHVYRTEAQVPTLVADAA